MNDRRKVSNNLPGLALTGGGGGDGEQLVGRGESEVMRATLFAPGDGAGRQGYTGVFHGGCAKDFPDELGD